MKRREYERFRFPVAPGELAASYKVHAGVEDDVRAPVLCPITACADPQGGKLQIVVRVELGYWVGIAGLAMEPVGAPPRRAGLVRRYSSVFQLASVGLEAPRKARVRRLAYIAFIENRLTLTTEAATEMTKPDTTRHTKIFPPEVRVMLRR